nr:hypothetical protein [uncultured Rhodoferax sp.]
MPPASVNTSLWAIVGIRRAAGAARVEHLRRNTAGNYVFVCLSKGLIQISRPGTLDANKTAVDGLSDDQINE